MDHKAEIGPSHFAFTLGLALLLALGFIAIRHQAIGYGEDRGFYWARKADASGPRSIVVGGDSRVYRGVNPKAFADDGLNFGFSAQGYSEAYIEALDRLTAPDGALLLAIDAPLFIGSVERIGDYNKLAARNAFERRIYAQLGPSARMFEPVPLSRVLRAIVNRGRPAEPYAYLQIWHDNGWVESDQDPRDASRQLAAISTIWAREAIDPTLVQTTLELVRSRDLVFGFEPPMALATREARERAFPGQMEELRRAFEAAGGVWIEIDPGQFETYDGVHLTAASARRLSETLAAEVQAHERP